MLGPHVVRIGQTEVFIETVPRGQKLRMVTEMPFPEDRRGIISLFQQLGDGGFFVPDTDFRRRPQCPQNAHAIGVTSG